jgi:hypothetical protein
VTPPRSEQLDQLAPALAAAQGKMKPAERNASNPHRGNRYADLTSVLEACRGPLAEHGLCLTQSIVTREGGEVQLVTTLLHTSGQWVGASYPVWKPAKDGEAPQHQMMGSALTYGRRYSITALVGVVADDDDDGERAGAVGRPAAKGRTAPRDDGRREVNREFAPKEGGEGRPPQSGKALFAWCKSAEEQHHVGMLKYLNGFGKLQEFPARMVDWNREQVGLAYAEGLRKLQVRLAGKDGAAVQPNGAGNGHGHEGAASKPVASALVPRETRRVHEAPDEDDQGVDWPGFAARRAKSHNDGLEALYEESGVDPSARHHHKVNAHQLAQVVAGKAVERGLPDPPKRTQGWASGVADRLWRSKAEQVQAVVEEYLAGKRSEARKAFGLLDDGPEDEAQAEPAAVGGREPGSDDE